jgi:outer membrane immunogenic protein
MKVAVVVAAVATVFASSAFAADLPVKAPRAFAAPNYNWSGFYIGADVGGHWSHDEDPASVTANTSFGSPAATPLFNQLVPVTQDPRGFAGGVHTGYNWQTANLVYGVEGSIAFLGGRATRNISALVVGEASQFVDSVRDRAMGSLRGRIGWAADRLLVYATGGVAFADWNLTHVFFSTDGGGLTGTADRAEWRTGGIYGGGIEYALDAHWLVRAEYMHASFGTATTMVNAVSGTGVVNFLHPEKLSENIALAGLSYKFGGR